MPKSKAGIVRKQMWVCVIAALLGLGALTLQSGCGGAAKQTNTNSNTGANAPNGGGGAESQPSK